MNPDELIFWADTCGGSDLAGGSWSRGRMAGYTFGHRLLSLVDSMYGIGLRAGGP